MGSNSITRDHHNLRRNLNLNDKYISNDGGDEGIRITDAGLVGIGVSDPDSLLEIFGTSTQLKLSYNADDYATFTVADTGDLTIATVGDGSTDSDLTLDADGDIYLNADGGDIYFKDASAGDIVIDADQHKISGVTRLAGATLTFDYSSDLIYFTNGGQFGFIFSHMNMSSKFQKWYYDANNNCSLTIAANGATTIATTDSDGALGHLTLDPDGDLIFSGCNVHIDSGKALYLDGGDDTYIYEHADDHVRYLVGDDAMMSMTEAGNDGNVIDFGLSGVGFLQHEPTYNATDTNVYFNRNGNKGHLTFTSASETIVDVHLLFPNVSCNCILLIKQHASGGGAVTNWKTWDQAGGNESTVVWAGGSAPTLTTGGGKIDIMSFYWDNDNHKAYGVASLNF